MVTTPMCSRGRWENGVESVLSLLEEEDDAGDGVRRETRYRPYPVRAIRSLEDWMMERAASRLGTTEGPEGLYFREEGLASRLTVKSQCVSLEALWCEMYKRGDVIWKSESGMMGSDERF
jgi:hypothetical protein